MAVTMPIAIQKKNVEIKVGNVVECFSADGK
jgi:hypothetical protein